MPVDLRLMRYVIAVADEGGFQRAAERLNMAQPPLSRQIRDLERELGVELFHRRPTRLTAAGRVFVESARRTLAEAERTVEQTRIAARGLTGTVRVGYTLTTAYEEMPKILAAMRERHSKIAVDAQEAWDPILEAGLQNGRYDVVLGRHLTVPEGFTARTLRSEPYLAVLSEKHPSAAKAQTSLRDLRGERLAFFPRKLAPTYYDAVLRALHSTGETFEIWETPTPGLRHLSIRDTGDGFTLLPRSTTRHLPGLACRPLTDDLPPIDLEIIWSSGTATPAVEAFLRTATALAHHERWIPPTA